MSSAHSRVKWLVDGPPTAAACFLCGNTVNNVCKLQALHPDEQHGFVDVAVCGACGSAWFPDGEAIRFTYPEVGDERPGSDFDLLVRHYLELVGGLNWKVALAERLDRDTIASVVEVGCSVGVFLDYLSEMWSADVVGLEPSAYGRAGCRHLGLPIETATMADAQTTDGKTFDLFVSTEVIEHVADPLDFLCQARSLLSERGVALLTTPRPGSLTPATPPGELYAALSVGAHYFLASEQIIRQWATAAGFSWVHIEPFGMTNVIVMANHDPAIGPLVDATAHVAEYYTQRSSRTDVTDQRTRLGDVLAAYNYQRQVSPDAQPGTEALIATLMEEVFGIDLSALADLAQRVLATQDIFGYGRAIPHALAEYLFWRGHRDDISELHRTELWETSVVLAAHGVRVDPINLFVLGRTAEASAHALAGRLPGRLRSHAEAALADVPELAGTHIRPASPSTQLIARCKTLAKKLLRRTP